MKLPSCALFIVFSVIGVPLWSQNVDSDALTATVVKDDLKIEIEVPGVFVAEDKAEIAMEPRQYSGELIITKIAAEGMNVKKNDILMEFDAANLDEALRQAENEVADAEVEWSKLQADFRASEIDVETKQSQLMKEVEFAERDYMAAQEFEALELEQKTKEVENAKRNLKNAKVDFEQLKQLYDERELHTATENILIERQTESLAEAEKNVARLEKELKHFITFQKSKDTLTKLLELEKKQAELEKQKIRGAAELQEKRSQVAKAERNQQRLQKVVSELKKDRDSLVVTAPRDGILFYGKTGTTSAAGLLFGGRSNPQMRIGGRITTHEILMTVAAMENLSVTMQVLENDIQHIKTGLAITIRPDAFPAMQLKGELTKVDQIATRSNFLSDVRRFTVKGRYNGAVSQLRSGMNCRVTIHADVIPDAIQVPIVAVVEEQGKYFCFVKNGRRSERREVEIGIANNQFVQITAGLLPDEVIFLYDPDRKTD